MDSIGSTSSTRKRKNPVEILRAKVDKLEKQLSENEIDVSEAKKKVSEAKKKVSEAEKKVIEAKQGIDDQDQENLDRLQKDWDIFQSLCVVQTNRLTAFVNGLTTLRQTSNDLRNTLEKCQDELHRMENLKLKIPRLSFPVLQCQEPSPLPHPASQTTSSEIDNRKTQGDVYHHWFALALYDLYTQELKTHTFDDQVNFTFMDKQMSIPISQLNAVVEQWKYGLTKNELFCTSLLALALDRFLFPVDDERPIGGCFHQMPLYMKSDRSDFCVLPFPKKEKRWELNKFVAISDFEFTDFEKSEVESLACHLRGQKDEHKLVRLVFPCSATKVKLMVIVPLDKTILPICVYESNISEPSHLEIFLCMLYAGVHYLLQHPILSNGSVCPTQEECEFYSICTSRKSAPKRVFTDQKYVYKMFDTTKNKPQLEVAQIVLKDSEEVKLSVDGRYKYLLYPFLPGNHESSKSSNQVGLILQQLHEIHEKGLVHSDVRLTNIVFDPETDRAWIIDFDLADKEGEPYPNNYNHVGIPERHQDARANKPRKKIHDVFALNLIADRFHIMEKYERMNNLYDIAKDLIESAED